MHSQTVSLSLHAVTFSERGATGLGIMSGLSGAEIAGYDMCVRACARDSSCRCLDNQHAHLCEAVPHAYQGGARMYQGAMCGLHACLDSLA